MKMMAKSLIGLLILGCSGVASANFNDSLPRSIRCNAFPGMTGVALKLVDKGDEVALQGRAHDSFNVADIDVCTVEANAIECAGTWRFEQERAELKIAKELDGTFKGWLLKPDGKTAIMGCLLSYNDE